MKKPVESQTPWDPTTWGFYCDDCATFFDLQTQGRVITFEENGEHYCRYEHNCGSDARYVGYSRENHTKLSRMREHYDKMLERMQTPEARAAMRRAFNATPEELGRAAARAAMLARLRPDEPCDHPGCLSHVSHPCEGCGRIAGKRPEK